MLPDASADWAGQALCAFFPDGLLSQARKNSLTLLHGWPRLQSPRHLEELKAAIFSIGGSALRIKSERKRDWVHEYKSRFPVQSLGRFIILPYWRRKAKVPAGKLPIILLPGQAFGTGLHDSTRLMLHAIETTASETVLDIGAGSGILGLACLRQGSKKVLSIEIEKAACEEMKGNARLNGFGPASFAVRAGTFPALLKGKKMAAGLVLANIVTPVLCHLMKAIAAQAAKGATVLLSGIHTESEARQVAKAVRAAGLKITGRESRGDWWCLRARK